jgi:uncharacterized membrane protein YdjX (TVP38/TMEM64 family)
VRLSPRLRLGLLVAFLVAGLAVFWIWRPIGEDEPRGVIAGLGWAAPAGFVLLSAALGCLLVPGPILSASAGLLFGPLAGTALGLCSAVLSAVVSLAVGRLAGRDGVRELVGEERFERAEALASRHGTLAVIAQRIAPIPDGPANYAFGAGGITVVQIVVGTLIGSLPRAFAYAALGSAAATLDPILAGAGIAVVVLMGLAFWIYAGREVRRTIRRRHAARLADDRRPTPGE